MPAQRNHLGTKEILGNAKILKCVVKVCRVAVLLSRKIFTAMIYFILIGTFIIGAFFGVWALSMCITSSRADAASEKSEEQKWYENTRP